MTEAELFSYDALTIDAEQEVERICTCIREHLRNQLKRRGVVVGLSGGIDSSVTAALAIKALGPERVFGLEVVAFLEETFSIRVLEEELLPENLDSLSNLAGFLGRKLATPQSEPVTTCSVER